MIWMPVLVNDINYKLYITYIFIQAHFFGLSEKNQKFDVHPAQIIAIPWEEGNLCHREEMKLMAL